MATTTTTTTTPTEEEIETFISITGVSKPIALQKLQEHGGDLNAAVNAHFSEGDRSVVRGSSVAPAQDDLMEIDDDDPVQVQPPRRSPFSLLSGADMLNPFSVLDPQFHRRFVDGGFDRVNTAPFVSQPREVREIPIEVKDGSDGSSRSGRAPVIEDVTESEELHDQGIRGTVVVADEDRDDIANNLTAQSMRRNELNTDPFGVNSQETLGRPTAPQLDDLPDYGNDIEEAMVQAAIEASKRDAQEIDEPRSEEIQSHMVDAEIERAVSLSLQTAELEKQLREQEDKSGASQAGASNLSNGRLEARDSSVLGEDEEVEEQPLVIQRPRRSSSRLAESASNVGVVDVSPSSSPDLSDVHMQPQPSRNAFPSDEWGGISSEEHDEAVMLEAAMFGGIPEGAGYGLPYAARQFMQNDAPYSRPAPRPPSPSLQAQRLIREQQDDEYLASLAADQEKELKAMQEAEARRLQEAAAREAALEEERQKEQENHRKLQEEQEMESLLAAKESSLPQEPASDDENAVTLLVRMPDGTRHGRRFLKSDTLQSLFDFIDIGRVVKPGSYRLVRPYPRRAFGDTESALTLNELGLTSKQEALFLELI